ncbi:MAG: response regulator [Anaerolineales bacterium]
MLHAQSNTLSVLIIEDQTELNRLYNKVLSSAGFRTLGCQSIQQARQHLTAPQLPHIVVMDLELSDGHGTELLSLLSKKAYQHIKVVVVSGHTYDQQQMGIERADYALLKPVSPRGLKALVQTIAQEVFVSSALS